MLLLNPIVANLHNMKTDRYHPILFEERPLPGPSTNDKLVRHKSKGHHPNGFDTRPEAIAECEHMIEKLAEHSAGPIRLCVDKDFPWDGEDIPAMVVFFGEQDGKTVPLLC